MGAVWAGGSDELPPHPLDAAIIFASAGPLVVAALRSVQKGCRVVCGGIHMSDIPSFPYSLLWEERRISFRGESDQGRRPSVLESGSDGTRANRDRIFLDVQRRNDALERLRRGRIRGAAVLVPNW